MSCEMRWPKSASDRREKNLHGGLRPFRSLVHYMADTGFVLEHDDDPLHVSVCGPVGVRGFDPNGRQGHDLGAGAVCEGSQGCDGRWRTRATGVDDRHHDPRSVRPQLMSLAPFALACVLVAQASAMLSASSALAAPTKAELGAMLKKCSEEADAKGLTVQKGKGTERTAYRRQCMLKNGVSPKKP